MSKIRGSSSPMPWPVSATAISTNSPLNPASHSAASLAGDAAHANIDPAVAADRIARIDQQVEHDLLQLHRSISTAGSFSAAVVSM
jgi:hypothetical protein